MRVMMAHNSSRPQITPGPSPPHTPKIFVLQIYMNHTNDLFWIQNGEFRRKVTSLHQSTTET